MSAAAAPVERRVATADGVALAARRGGPPGGRPVVLMHGLTMTSQELSAAGAELERDGLSVLAYDARGHGRSSAPPDPHAYGYEHLEADALAVMAAFDVRRAVLVGSSMGAQTALRIALRRPERVAGLVVINPGYDPERPGDGQREWSRLALVLRLAGPDGFSGSLQLAGMASERAAVVRDLTRRRMAEHRQLDAVAAALEAVPRAAPFGSLGELAAIDAPALVVASRDDYDPVHPLALAERYAAALPRCAFVCEPSGALPLAWRGAELASHVRELAEASYARPAAPVAGGAP